MPRVIPIEVVTYPDCGGRLQEAKERRQPSLSTIGDMGVLTVALNNHLYTHQSLTD